MDSAETAAAQSRAGTRKKSSHVHLDLVTALVASRRPTIKTSTAMKIADEIITPLPGPPIPPFWSAAAGDALSAKAAMMLALRNSEAFE